MINTQHFINKNKKVYFEGWYFRHSGDNPFSLIVGISKCNGNNHSFVQYIDNLCSHYFTFELKEFSYNKTEMIIKVADNTFSQNGITAKLLNQDVAIKIDVAYSDMILFSKSMLTPNAMGFFTYLPNACNHAVISHSHNCVGTLQIDNQKININCKGYIEKDFGTKFPEHYFWTHANYNNTSIMCAVAWPLIFNIRGFLCFVSHEGKQYNLSLYTGAKLKQFTADSNEVTVNIKHGDKTVELVAKTNDLEQKLLAPTTCGMNKFITENLSADIKCNINLDKSNISLNTKCAFELVL